MSGRTLHWRDGELITNRKTDRRQSKARPLIDRVDELGQRFSRRQPTTWPVHMVFVLPKNWQPFVADGQHGIGVDVFRGVVRVSHGSACECYQSAIEFCAKVGKDRSPEIFLAVVRSTKDPDQRRFGRWCCVVNGALVVSTGLTEPQVYEVR